MKASSVQAGSLEALLKECDYISLHLPITDETKKIINQKTIALMKPDARLINCARGELIDETSLISALELKKIKGAALDVFTKEPLENSMDMGINLTSAYKFSNSDIAYMKFIWDIIRMLKYTGIGL